MIFKNAHSSWVTICLAALLAVGAAGCKSAGDADRADETEVDRLDPNSIDEGDQSPQPTTTKPESSDEAVLMLPTPPEELSKTIDADFSDWDASEMKSFGQKRHVEAGEQFWDGESDASFDVGVFQDQGYVYFAVDVTDDRVIDAGSSEVMADGVIIWIRDPELDSVVDALPPTIRNRTGIKPEIAVLFTPDGQFWRYDDDGAGLYRAGIEAATKKTDDGFRLEAAVTAGVLGHVAQFPMTDIAFRVELMDGDEPDNRGRQTHMSMLPYGGDDDPSYALLGLDGLVPHEKVVGQPPRPAALGRWTRGSDGWRYSSFEVNPDSWVVDSELAELEKIVAESGALDGYCKPATSKTRVVESFLTHTGTHRAALVYCGERAPSGRCPRDAESHLLWVHFHSPRRQQWSHRKTVEVSREPLPQCFDEPRGEGMYSGFSMIPVELVGGSVWAIGWQHARRTESWEQVEQGVWFANTERSKPLVGRVLTSEVDADSESRIVSDWHVYLTEVDRQEGVDICAVEHLEEQSCAGFNRGCQTPHRGVQQKVQIWNWQPDKGEFQKFLLTKHRNCKASFDFSKRDAYMILQREGRVGLVPSPSLSD